MMTTRRLCALTVAASLLFAAACSQKMNSTASTDPMPVPQDAKQSPITGKKGGHLVLAMAGEPKTYNIFLATDVSSVTYLRSMFPSLIGLDFDSMKDQLELARSLEISSDGKIYTLKIRRGLQWSDGKPFTVDDVLFSYQVMVDPKILTGIKDVFKQSDESYPLLEKLDSETLRFTQKEVNALFTSVIGNLYILPKHHLEKDYLAGNFMQTLLVGSDPKFIPVLGPYMIDSYTPGQRIVFKANPYYWKFDKNGVRLPYIPRVTRLIVPDHNSTLIKFQNGETDMHEVQPSEFDLLKAGEAAGAYTVYDLGPGLNTHFFDLNLGQKKNAKGVPYVDPRKTALFNDKRFRQALSYAIDREGIVKTVFQGRAVPISTLTSPGNKLWKSPTPMAYPYDLNKARALLDEIGIKDKNGDGIREFEDGRPVEFTIKTNTERASRVQMGNLIKQDFAAIGVQANFRPVPFNSLVVSLDDTRDYEGVILGWAGGVPPDPLMSKNIILSSGRSHSWNPEQKSPATLWEKRMDELILKNQTTTNLKERQKYWWELLKIWEEELPQIMLVADNMSVAIKNKYGNTKPSVMRPYYEWNIEELYDKTLP